MENYQYQWAAAATGDQNSSSTLLKRPPGTAKRSTASTGVKLSTDPQSVAARQRRHRISDRFRVLKSLVPGGSKMDTVSMLEEAINYVKFLKAQIWLHQAAMTNTTNYPTHDELIIINNNNNILAFDNVSNVASYGVLPAVQSEEMVSYNNYSTASSPALPPLPYCSFQGEEILPPPTSFY